MITILALCGVNGEVEDYGFAVTPLAVTLEGFETVGSQWGILPAISLTLLILVAATLLLIRRGRIARDRI